MNTSNLTPRLLVIEDEIDLRDALVTYFQLEGIHAVGAGTLVAAERLMGLQDFDILVLDLGMPDGDGVSWLQEREDLVNKGIIIVTARGLGTDRIAGLRAGADIYLVKPVLPEELVLQASNLFRRMQGIAKQKPLIEHTWKYQSVNWLLVSPEGKEIKLTHSESTLVSMLANKPGQVLLRKELILALGHQPDYYDPKRMEIMVRRLRTKAQAVLSYPLPLDTVHGAGYAFTAPIEVFSAANQT